MVICNEHDFIFLRIPKNASTSLATFFVKNYCGLNDIHTYIGNSGVPTRGVSQEVVKRYQKDHRIIHLTLNEIVDSGVITAEEARAKRVIGVLRNPLERQLSLFFFLNKEFKKNDDSPEAFRRAFRNGCHESDPSNAITQYDYCLLGDENIGDYWFYENLDNHVKDFVKEKGVTVKEDVKRYKSNYRERQDMQALIDEYYDDETLMAVGEYYAKDFELYDNLRDA